MWITLKYIVLIHKNIFTLKFGFISTVQFITGPGESSISIGETIRKSLFILNHFSNNRRESHKSFSEVTLTFKLTIALQGAVQGAF